MTTVNIDGQEYIIENMDEVKYFLLYRVGQLALEDIKYNIRRLGLQDSGRFINGLTIEVDMATDSVDIVSDVEYSYWLEYGTMDFGAQYSKDDYPAKPVKKKDMTRAMAKQFPKGMNPFAPFRRTIFNRTKMELFYNRALQELKSAL